MNSAFTTGTRWAGFVSLFLAGACGAQPLDEEAIDRGTLSETGAPGIEATTGFIVDRTVTNVGAEFFRQFSEAWRGLPGTESVNVTIVERPSARYGSQIYIEQDGRPVARVFLYAGRGATIRPLAVEAARYVGGRLSDAALTGMMFMDPDLGGDELRGVR